MKNGKLIFIILIVLAIAFLLGGFIMTIFWFLMKIIFGLIAIGLVVGAFYLGRKSSNKTQK